MQALPQQQVQEQQNEEKLKWPETGKRLLSHLPLIYSIKQLYPLKARAKAPSVMGEHRPALRQRPLREPAGVSEGGHRRGREATATCFFTLSCTFQIFYN